MRPIRSQRSPSPTVQNRRKPATGRHRALPKRLPPQPNRLPETLLAAIETDPVFQVVTDDFHWIDPFTGEAIPAQQGRVEAARTYLLETGVWQYSNPLTRQELDVIRWRLDLVPRLREEPRLRLFTRDGLWVNPYTGTLVQGVRREDGKITRSTVLDLARALAACDQASTGLMLDPDTLRQRVRAVSRDDSGGHPVTTIDTPPRPAPPGTTSMPAATPDPLHRARDVQQRMLASLPTVEGYELAVHYAPCAMVGGDFYDCIELTGGRRLFLVGDVSGHGVEAALVVASALSTLRLLSRGAANTTELLARFNEEARRDLVPGQFITLFTAELDPGAHQLTCFCAGHHPALLFNPTGEHMLRRVGNSGMAVGLTDSDTFRSSLVPVTIALQHGDVLMQYTDGITEAYDERSNAFGELRMCAAAFNQLDNGAQALVDGVAEAALRFAGGQMSDDVTVFALGCAVEPDDLVATDEWVWPLQSD